MLEFVYFLSFPSFVVGLAIVADPPHPLYNYAQPHANIPQRAISFHYYLWTLVRSLFSLAPSL